MGLLRKTEELVAKEERRAAEQATDTPCEVNYSLAWILCHPQRCTVGPRFSRTHLSHPWGHLQAEIPSQRLLSFPFLALKLTPGPW